MIWPPYIEGGISHAMAKASAGTYDRTRECHHSTPDIHVVLCDDPWFLCKACLDEKMLRTGELRPEKCIRCAHNTANRMTHIAAEMPDERKVFFHFGICDNCLAGFTIEVESVRSKLRWR